MVRCSNVVFFGRSFGLWFHSGPMLSTADSDSGIFETVQCTGFKQNIRNIRITSHITGFGKKHQKYVRILRVKRSPTCAGPFWSFFCVLQRN